MIWRIVLSGTGRPVVAHAPDGQSRAHCADQNPQITPRGGRRVGRDGTRRPRPTTTAAGSSVVVELPHPQGDALGDGSDQHQDRTDGTEDARRRCCRAARRPLPEPGRRRAANRSSHSCAEAIGHRRHGAVNTPSGRIAEDGNLRRFPRRCRMGPGPFVERVEAADTAPPTKGNDMTQYMLSVHGTAEPGTRRSKRRSRCTTRPDGSTRSSRPPTRGSSCGGLERPGDRHDGRRHRRRRDRHRRPVPGDQGVPRRLLGHRGARPRRCAQDRRRGVQGLRRQGRGPTVPGRAS